MSEQRAPYTDGDKRILAIIQEGQACMTQGDRIGAEQRFLAALDDLVSVYQRQVVGFCMNMLPDHAKHQAEDIGQEAFLAAHRHMPHFRGEASTRTWLFAIVRRRCLSALRTIRHEARRRVSDPRATAEEADARPLPAQLYELQEEQRRLARGLDQLPPLDRAVVGMYRHEGITTKDIAESLNITPAAVRQRVRRALQRLRTIMATLDT